MMLSMTALVSVSATSGTKLTFKWFGRRNLYPNLWIMCIDESGQGKTTTLTAASEYLSYRDAIIGEAASQERERLISERMSPEKKAFLVDRILATSPKFASRITHASYLYQKSLGKKGAFLLSEITTLADGLDAKHNIGFKNTLIDHFDCPKGWESSTKGRGIERIAEVYTCIAGFCVPDALHKLADKASIESGFLPRFLIIRSTGRKNDAPFSPPIIDKEERSPGFDAFRAYLDTIDSFLKREREYTCSPEAYAAWKVCDMRLKEIGNYNGDVSGPIKSFLPRWNEYLIKLAMLLRVIEDPESTELSEKSIYGAFMFVLSACKSTLFVLKNDTLDGHSEIKNKLWDWIQKYAKKNRRNPKWRDLVNNFNIPEAAKACGLIISDPSKMREWIIKELVEADLIDFDLKQTTSSRGQMEIKIVR